MPPSVHVVPVAQPPIVPGGEQNGSAKHWSPTHVHEVGQSALERHETLAMHDAVPRLQIVPDAQSVFARHGVVVHAPARQRAPIGQSVSRAQVAGAEHEPSTQCAPIGQSASRPQLPTNTQPVPMHTSRAGQSASVVHAPVNTQRPLSHA